MLPNTLSTTRTRTIGAPTIDPAPAMSAFPERLRIKTITARSAGRVATELTAGIVATVGATTSRSRHEHRCDRSVRRMSRA